MSSRIQTVSELLAPAPISPLKAFWQLPSLTIARFTLLSYIRSGWVIGDIVLVWLFYAAFFLEFGGDVPYFYGTGNLGLMAIAVLGTVVMSQRALNARVYLPLARLTSRGAYVRGVLIATGVLRIPLFLLLLVLAMLYRRHSVGICTPVCIEGATLQNMLPGALGLLLNTCIVAIITVAFSAPIATRWARIGLLLWIVAILYSNTTPGGLAGFLSFTRIPLIPISTLYGFGQHPEIGWTGLLAILVALIYIGALTLLTQFWMAHRDLLLQ